MTEAETNGGDQRRASSYKPLDEYGVIGNLETVALVGRDGIIDWCCFPHVEDASVFARLLDTNRGGHMAITPVHSFQATQEYIDRTNVLRTQFQTNDGQASVTDFMPVRSESEDGIHRRIYRKVICDDGRIDLSVEFAPRFDYARITPSIQPTDNGVVATTEEEELFLSGNTPFEIEADTASTSITLSKGETRWFVLSYDHAISSHSKDKQTTLESVIEYWRNWMHGCRDASSCPVGGPWHDLAIRSELALKLLTHQETSAICAAPTTSLPEVIGGTRNWDYRFNWIRDSTFTVNAFAQMNHFEEVQEYFSMCLAHCSHGTPAEMQPVYGLHGEMDLEECTLDYLEGYRHSKPVRIGNDAATQQQLDVYGELVVGVHEMTRREGTISADEWELLRAIGNYVCGVWREKDLGIWEMRATPEHFVYSKVMCWAALDRCIKFVAETEFDGPVEQWKTARNAIHETVLRRGYNEDISSFVRSFEQSDHLDAALLRLPVVGFLPPDDPRIEGTIDAVLDRLTPAEGLVRRIEGDDGLDGGEGAFVACSFWLITALALAGRVEEAAAHFEAICEYAQPHGLLAEEIDPKTGEQRGNFPQAFSQIGLINSLVYLREQGVDFSPSAETIPPTPATEQSATEYEGRR